MSTKASCVTFSFVLWDTRWRGAGLWRAAEIPHLEARVQGSGWLSRCVRYLDLGLALSSARPSSESRESGLHMRCGQSSGLVRTRDLACGSAAASRRCLPAAEAVAAGSPGALHA